MPITDDDAVDILKERSQVMCKRIVTVRQDMILKKITRVTDTFYDKVTRKIQDDVLEI